MFYLDGFKVGQIITGVKGVKRRLITMESLLKNKFAIQLWRDKIVLGDSISM